MIRVLHRASLLAWMRLLPARRNPIGLILVFLYPAFFVFLYTVVGGRHMTSQVLLGLPVVYILNAGVVSLPQTTLEYSLRHIKDIFVSSPVTPFTYMLGMGLSRLMYVLPVIMLWFLAALAVGAVSLITISGVVLVLLATWLVGCAIGFMLTTYLRDIVTMSAAANLLGLTLSILPPVLYPIDLLPHPYGELCLLIPSVSAAHLLRVIADATAYDTGAYVAGPLAILFAWALVSGSAAAFRSRWREA